MKYFFLFFIFVFLLFQRVWALALSQEDIIPRDTDGSFSTLTSATWLWVLDVFLAFIKDSIFWLLALIFISIMIYVGVKLFIARGNEEEYSKALWTFMYAVIGMIIVLLSYAAVRLIVWLSL